MPPRRLVTVAARAGLVIGGILIATLIAEGAARLRDGQPLFARRLAPLPTLPSVPPRRAALALDPEAGGGPLPSEVNGEWLANPPPAPPRRKPDSALVERAAEATRNGLMPFEAFRIWNAQVVRDYGCGSVGNLRRLPQPIPTFDPVEPGIAQPPFRYLSDASMPGGLVTNRFGFRGPDVPIDKQPTTIRVAFVGASTTVGLWHLPWSYPELVVHWLNLWATENNLAVRFDGVNAGREGVGSSAIAAITRQEVLPLEPDLVVYYEGANQSLCTLPAPDAPPPSSLPKIEAGATQPEVSALARQLRGLMAPAVQGGSEPAKPVLPSNPERDAYASPPQLDAASLPLRERTILHDLETLRLGVRQSGAQLVLTSFEFLVFEGMELDPQRDAVIFRHLNQHCWPYRYADLRRANDLHNGLMAAFAARHEIPFIDVAASFSDDPRLFYDAIHLNADGTRLQAWITFRGLLPVIREHLARGDWPRLDHTPQTTHPALQPPRLETVNCTP